MPVKAMVTVVAERMREGDVLMSGAVLLEAPRTPWEKHLRGTYVSVRVRHEPRRSDSKGRVEVIHFRKREEVDVRRAVPTNGDKLRSRVRDLRALATAEIERAEGWSFVMSLPEALRTPGIHPAIVLSTAHWDLGEVMSSAATFRWWLEVAERLRVEAETRDSTSSPDTCSEQCLLVALRTTVFDAKVTAQEGPEDSSSSFTARFIQQCEWRGTARFVAQLVPWGQAPSDAALWKVDQAAKAVKHHGEKAEAVV